MENNQENMDYEELINRIERYKKSLEKYIKEKNDKKLQYYIEKLRTLPIEIVHLEKTEVGPVVNQVRNGFDGKTRELAKKCVNGWKELWKPKFFTEEDLAQEAALRTAKEEAKKKSLLKKEQEKTDRDKRNENAAPNHSKHHGEYSSSHHKDSDSKHKSHKRSHSSDDHHSKKLKKDDHYDKDNHHKSQDHHSTKQDDQKKKHRSEEDKHKSRSQESKDKHKEQTKKDRSSSSKEPSKDKKSSSSSSSKSKSVTIVNSGIDSESGASFAEALGMCEPTSSKTTMVKKDVTKKKSSSSPAKKSKHENDKPSRSSAGPSSSSSSKSHSKSTHSSPPNPDDSLPKLLKEPVLALDDLNISSHLPAITPNYRPLGNITMPDVASKKQTEYEALSSIITSKNQRTKVYSGNKCLGGKVPTLFDMCIRILQDNIDSLEFTGGVPFHILKPILDKANPNQLYLLEHHNPYLIEDTDNLWYLHCQKDFRNKQRLELESWREMYMRCLDEREAKLIALTANIKQAQDNSIPLRKVKLAFVDDIAKPPRNVARQQAKNGTGSKQFDKKPLVTPSSRLSTLANLATSGEAGKVSVPNPGARAAERSSASAHKIAKKAPLMAKTLSLLKNRFKR